jgi:hypothetical protein
MLDHLLSSKYNYAVLNVFGDSHATLQVLGRNPYAE